MNDALFSSKDMNWCTPVDFFEELDHEFHFELDPAATDKSAKCPKYFTPADNGLDQSWGGGTAYSATRPTADRSPSGCAKATRKGKNQARSWLCSFLHELTRNTGTTTFSTGRPTKCASYAAA